VGTVIQALQIYSQCEIENYEGTKKNKQTPLPEFASELYRPSDRCLSVKLVPTFELSVTDPYGRIIGFLDRNYEGKWKNVYDDDSSNLHLSPSV
jgi:hypothetical protein